MPGLHILLPTCHDRYGVHRPRKGGVIAMYVKCSFSVRMRLSKSFSKQFEILTLNLCGAQFLGCNNQQQLQHLGAGLGARPVSHIFSLSSQTNTVPDIAMSFCTTFT